MWFGLFFHGWLLFLKKMELATDADFIDEGTQVDESNPMSDMRTRFKRGITIRMTRRPPNPPQRYDSTAWNFLTEKWLLLLSYFSAKKSIVLKSLLRLLIISFCKERYLSLWFFMHMAFNLTFNDPSGETYHFYCVDLRCIFYVVVAKSETFEKFSFAWMILNAFTEF